MKKSEMNHQYQKHSEIDLHLYSKRIVFQIQLEYISKKLFFLNNKKCTYTRFPVIISIYFMYIMLWKQQTD